MKGKDFKKDLDHLESFLNLFRNKYSLADSEILSLLKQNKKKEIVFQTKIPLSIFVFSNLGYREALVKYLKEYSDFKIKDISKLLKISVGSLWATYYKSKEKSNYTFNDSTLEKLNFKFQEHLNKVLNSEIFLDSSKKIAQNYYFTIDNFTNDKYSVFQNLVLSLSVDYNFKNIIVAKILKTRPQAVWNSLNKINLLSNNSDNKNKILSKNRGGRNYQEK